DLHRIGQPIIQQLQRVQYKQHYVHPPCSPHYLSNRSSPFSPMEENSTHIPLLMNLQQQSLNVRPLIDLPQATPISASTSTPRRPASDSFNNGGEKHHHMSKRIRINGQSSRNQ
ncbi:unnamed protein product, partial [Rotaria sp. Silwood2]